MAKYLLTVWPFNTHIYPNVALAHALARHGHEVGFYCAGEYERLIQGEGFRLFPFHHVDASRVVGVMAALINNWSKPLRMRELWRQFLVDTIPAQLEDIDSVLLKWVPDVIVSDVAMWGPILFLAETRDVLVAMFSHVGYCMLPGEEGIHPGVSLRFRNKHINHLFAKVASHMIELATRGIRQAVNSLRASHRLPPLNTSPVQYTGRAPLYLIPSAPEFDVRNDRLPPSVHYVGPCLWEKSEQGPAAVSIPRNSPGNPSVLVVHGDLHRSDAGLLQSALCALANRRMNLVVVKGRQLMEARLVSSGPNVRVLETANISKCVSSADVVVTHGGSEVVLPALAQGVPLVVVPSVLEEPHMAWRIEASGAGVRIPAARCTPERLLSAVEKVIGDPSFRNSAQDMARAFARHGGPEEAAVLLEQLARTKA